MKNRHGQNYNTQVRPSISTFMLWAQNTTQKEGARKSDLQNNKPIDTVALAVFNSDDRLL